jgi:hypothetical protein
MNENSKEKSYSELTYQLERLQNLVVKLEKENQDLKQTTKRLADSDKKFKEVLSQIDLLEKEKVLLKEEVFQAEKNCKDLLQQKELEHASEVSRLKFEIDMYNEKIKSFHSLERLKDCLQKDVVLLKKELILLQENYKEEMRMKERQHDMEFDDLNNDMLARINNTKKNIKQINLEHLDVSTKLTLLQNHQLLIELEYQSQQIQDLIQKKEALERRVFELEKDVEIHKEVENVLADKNKKLSNTLKSIVSNTESARPFVNSGSISGSVDLTGSKKLASSQSNKYIDSKNNTLIGMGVKTGFTYNTNASSRKFDESSLLQRLENKVRKLEKDLNKKTLENDALRLNYEAINKELQKYSNKGKGIIKVFETELESVIKTGEVQGDKNIFLDLDTLHDFKYNELPSKTKYSLLILLIDYLLSILNLEDFNDSNSLIGKVKKKNVQLKFHNASMEEIKTKSLINPLNDNKYKLLSNNPIVTRAKIFNELLPTIADSRFSINKKCSILKS